MVSKSAILKELQIRIDRAKAQGNWRMAETYTAIWYRTRNRSQADLDLSGLSKRMAAAAAPVSLQERL